GPKGGAAPKPKEPKKVAPREPRMIVPPVVVTAPPPEPFRPEKTVTFDELGPNMCRWPIGDPCDENFCYCGCPSNGKPFCDEHDKVAYGERRVRSGKSL